MKFPSLFTKTPQHKRFSYQPRYYDPQEEVRKEREARIRNELKAAENQEALAEYRSRIAGSFRQAKKTAGRQADPSANLLRIIILILLVVWLIAYLQFGKPAIYALLLFVPVYVYVKFKKR
jgi:Flp pilus assembly protein TadB